MHEAASILYACPGGTIVLPAAELVLVDRGGGGNLVVNPPRTVWERSELARDDLVAWSFLVAATGQAMLERLPQLEGGCLNYWEAGNWALNREAEPKGDKTGPEHRQVHLHLLGRGRFATSPDLVWGEAPFFPTYARRLEWAAANARLTAEECSAIVVRAVELLREKYGVEAADPRICAQCGYPAATPHGCAEG